MSLAAIKTYAHLLWGSAICNIPHVSAGTGTTKLVLCVAITLETKCKAALACEVERAQVAKCNIVESSQVNCAAWIVNYRVGELSCATHVERFESRGDIIMVVVRVACGYAFYGGAAGDVVAIILE